ncbi:Arc family DNA-binding protein [Listeria monocytogenes]|nr:Arc family DNA-binding protein [Listeria monocytogenes]EAG7074004.1 Arc family DNA-binding protein [Listeria monocytogenes]EIL9238526.1 Arc family DNA-binding protein [Listeria monocytogenes]
MATYKNPHFAIRIPKELLQKLKYIAGYNARSANKEIEFLVRKHVEQFEKEHGTIKVDMDSN